MKNTSSPLYKRITDNIVERIREGDLKPGSRLPSEHELAESMFVNRLTVRKAYKSLYEKGLLYAVQGKGTFVSNEHTILTSDSINNYGTSDAKKVIGIIFPEITLFFNTILKTIEELASQNGYSVNIMFNDSAERETNAVNSMLANKVDGIIINPLRQNNYYSTANYKKLVKSNLPLVMIGKPPFGIECDSVMCDDISATCNAIKYLFSKGHKNILHLYHSLQDEEALYERNEGIIKAYKEVFPDCEPFGIDTSDDNWPEKAVGIVENKGVTCIFSDSEHHIVHLFNLLTGKGDKIPESIELLCYNNTDLLSQTRIPSHSIEIPKVDMGARAFNMLKQSILLPNSKKSYASFSIFTPKLKVYGE